MRQPILILGGGNMGGALARAWHQAALGSVRLVVRDAAKAEAFRAAGMEVYPSLGAVPDQPMTFVLAIKPQQFHEIKSALKYHPATQGTLISVMAGIRAETLAEINPRVARIIPNLPALIGESMSVAYAHGLDAATLESVDRLFEAIGPCLWVNDEALLHSGTGIAGSGSGYVFAFMEALEKAALAEGFDAETARLLVAQTLRGAALLAGASEESFTRLREQVTSPNGTTQAALTVLAQGQFSDLIGRAVAACVARSKELSS